MTRIEKLQKEFAAEAEKIRKDNLVLFEQIGNEILALLGYNPHHKLSKSDAKTVIEFFKSQEKGGEFLAKFMDANKKAVSKKNVPSTQASPTVSDTPAHTPDEPSPA
jgi:thioredoxin-related protein